jgi:hypothetical protein
MRREVKKKGGVTSTDNFNERTKTHTRLFNKLIYINDNNERRIKHLNLRHFDVSNIEKI